MTARQHAVPAVFGRRLIREREAHGWSLREAGIKVGLSASTVMRAEAGQDCALSTAITLAVLYGLALSDLLAEGPCERCDGKPPAGFICGTCGRGGEDAVKPANNCRYGEGGRLTHGNPCTCDPEFA